MIALFLLLSAAAAPKECPPYRELRPPRITRDRSVFFFTRSVDPAWFDCARRQGGKVTVVSEIERAGGVWDLDHQEGSGAAADIHAGAWASNYCGRSGKTDPLRLRFVVKGEGPLSPMSFTSETRPALCGCTVYPSSNVKVTPSAAGLAIDASVTEAHLACMSEPGSWAEVRAYTGHTVEEARQASRPVWVSKPLDPKSGVKAVIPRKALCAGGASEAVLELAGHGQLHEITGYGEERVHLDCKQAP